MKIVFDVDDILWDLNGYICKKHNIPFENIREFHIHDNKETLTERQQEILIAEYAKADIYHNLDFYPAAYSIKDLPADVSICTNTLTGKVADVKRLRLKNELGIAQPDITVNVITVGQAKKKKLPENVTYFVDDSPYNIMQSHAKENILMRKPWNITDNARKLMQGKNYRYFDTLDEIVDYLKNKIVTNL